MSKVSFRARALDVSKPMPIYMSEEIPDMRDFDKINRAVLQMPTGMEKEEETETHLQKALTAQQFYGTAVARTIPIPDAQSVDDDRYFKLYKSDFKLPKQYIHVQDFGMEQEMPDYDLDSEDEGWWNDQIRKMELSSLKFEEMMDRLEKGSGQQVVTLAEAKCLLKEDDDLIMSVYDYWLNKRLRLAMPLISHVKSEKRDGTSTNNPYVAFRRRTEKMQTRKNRKNDESSYERMLKLKRDTAKALILTQYLKRREKTKKENLTLCMEILAKRYQLCDFHGLMLSEAEKQQMKRPHLYTMPTFTCAAQLPYNGVEAVPVRKKRPYRRRQKRQHHGQPISVPCAAFPAAALYGNSHVLLRDMETSDEDPLSPAMSPSDHDDQNDPDGPFAFKRRKFCQYYEPLHDPSSDWPQCSPGQGGDVDDRHRFSLTCPSGCRGVNYIRRRVGRGGRLILDRGYSPWDEQLQRLDLQSGDSFSGLLGEYHTYIRERKIPYYRPVSPLLNDESPKDDPTTHDCLGDRYCCLLSPNADVSLDNYHSHLEQVKEMSRRQESRLSNCAAVSSDISAVRPGESSGDVRRSAPTSVFCVRNMDRSISQLAITAVNKFVDRVGGRCAGDAEPARHADHPTGSHSAIVVTTAPAGASALVSVSLSCPSAALFPPPSSPVEAVSLPATCQRCSIGQLLQAAHHSQPKLHLLSSLSSLAPHHLPSFRRPPSNGPVMFSSQFVRSNSIAGRSVIRPISCRQQVTPVATPLQQSVAPKTPGMSAPNDAGRTPSTPTTPSSAQGCMASSLLVSKLMNGKMSASASITLSPALCNLPSSSSLSMLKPKLDDGTLFTADPAMPMDVS